MAEIIVEQEQNNTEVYFTQGELAKRWRVTEATIKSIRETGGVSFFIPPNSSRVLYPVEEVIRIEANQLVLNKKEKQQQKEPVVNKRIKPVNPTNSKQEWRI